MANNPNVNKVEYNGQTLMDLTGDTVTQNDVRSGVTFHDRSGAAQQGGLIISPVYNGLDSSSTTDALSANQGRVLANRTPIFISGIGPGQDGTIEMMANALINQMTEMNRWYLFRSSWPDHPSGYIGYGFGVQEGSTKRYYGHIMDGSANVYDFYKTDSVLKIKSWT